MEGSLGQNQIIFMYIYEVFFIQFESIYVTSTVMIIRLSPCLSNYGFC